MAASPTVMDHADGSYSLEEEIELLGAIYIHELTLQGPRERPIAVSVLLHPSTGEEEDKRFVCLTLVICLPEKYPAELPSIHIKTPRGLSEAHVESILENLRELAEGCLGRPMLYELIEYAKESLTDNNTPSCACAICLGHFQDDHEFTKTECYHYFHCGCLARYIEFSLQQEKETEDDTKVECPMCRLPITYDLAELKTVTSSAENEEEFIYKPSAEIRKLQKKMSSLLEKQKRKGGVIDVQQERNKFLIDITSVRQEESEPPTGDETDTVKKNPIAEHLANDVSKRVDAEKEPSQADAHVMRKDKPERKEKKDFAKYSGISRGPRRPFDKTRHRSGREKFQNNEQRTTEKKRPTTCDRPESVEQEEKEKESARESDKQGSDFALWAETNSDDNRTQVESEKKSRVGETPEKALGKDPGKGPGKDPRKGPGEDPGKGPGKDQEKDQGNGPIKDPGKGPGKYQEKDPGNGHGKYPGKGSGNDPVKHTGKGTRRDQGKDERSVTGRSYNNKSSENSYGERPRSARRGRGRSGRGQSFAGSPSESGGGVRNMNKSRTSSGEAVKLSEVTGALEKSKPPLEKNGRLKAQNNSHQENLSREDGRSIKKGQGFQASPWF